MKRIALWFILFLTSQFVFAKPIHSFILRSRNQCIQQLDKHITGDGQLILSNCNLQDSDILELVFILPSYNNVWGLHVDSNNIGPAGAAYLSTTVSIEALDVSNNPIGPNGMAYLANNHNFLLLEADNVN